MTDTWVISDTHFGHRNIITFKDTYGNLMRPFSSIEEHDELIIQEHNKLVKPNDKVYHLGDVAIAKKSISQVGRLNGRKILLRGNHDIFKLRDYTPYFSDVRAYKMYPTHGVIMSHIPVHLYDSSTTRWKYNIHGHTHCNKIDDPKYINVCLEHTDFKPVNLDTILKELSYAKN